MRRPPGASCLGSSLPGRKLSRLAPTNVGTLCAFLTGREKCGLEVLPAAPVSDPRASLLRNNQAYALTGLQHQPGLGWDRNANSFSESQTMNGETSLGSASSNAFFEHPILNSPYECPPRHWELDGAGQPTQKIIERRRSAKFITPIPKPKKRKTAAQPGFVFDEGLGLSTKAQAYDPTSIINEVRGYVDRWRSLRPNQWQVTPETARLLEHWRHHEFSDVRPFFCQVEAVETAIWLTEVAGLSKNGQRVLDHLAAANRDANPELSTPGAQAGHGCGQDDRYGHDHRWQTVNAVRHPTSKQFTRGFLVSKKS